MSSSTLPKASDLSAADDKKRASRPRRGTLQSGFSLLSRGEPKIWLTGGMLVICLAMILGLLGLIVVNGVATFWPGPLDWLILNNHQMDIGEPQSIEYHKPDSAEGELAALTNAVTPEGTPAPKAGEEPSRFYRTANFDITGRHYRWFEPQELERSGIVRPEWALVIERLSWGRMLALPSRLALPVGRASDSDTLTGMLATDSLMKELAGELEGLAAATEATANARSGQPDAQLGDLQPTDAAAQAQEAPQSDETATPEANEAAEAAAVPQESLLAKLSGALASGIERARSRQVRESILDRLQQRDGRVLVQAAEGAQWSPLGDEEQLKSFESIAAAQVVWDAPSEILERIEPLIAELSGKREEISDLMHEISRLDRRLSDARVSVRQAELDTGRSVLAQVDNVGPLVETLVTLERLEERLRESAARAPQEFSDQPEQATTWQQLAAAYERQVLAPALQSARAALDTWQQEFAQQPTEIRNAASEFAATWRKVVEQKQPLEKQIRDLQAESEGFELAVLVPSDPQPVELSQDDWQQLEDGAWSNSAKAALADQGLAPLADSTEATHLNPQVTQVTFVDLDRGRQVLWCVDRSQAPAINPTAALPVSAREQTSPTDAAADADSTSEATANDIAANDIAVPSDAAPASDAADIPAVGGRYCMLTPQRVISCNEIVRIFPANRLGLLGKLSVYGSRWREFLLDDPREANTEGGVFPAIWGTVVMTLIMTLAVVPFGVIAALYLREYTRSGPLVSLVRISINNLAGVPSIVYGVFGLAFFCYTVGAYVDGGPQNADFGALPSGTWYTLLGLTVLVGVVAFLFSLLSSGNQRSTKRLPRLLARGAPVLWFLSLIGVGVLLFKSPFFDGFYEARLPTPTFGKEGLIWASLTLSLLTLPVVIVATEEALAAVPNSLREGSLACGASKWQTIRRIVLPHARPGILTGAILAMARGIGEVAPLMLVGALPVAPDLPLDTEFPYFHGSRSFMHLGYQIYWLGFQSQNSEASKPLVFTCTLLLLLLVIALNLSAIVLRARLRRRFQGNQF